MKNFWRLSGIYVVGSASAFASDSVVFLKFVVEIFKPLIQLWVIRARFFSALFIP